MSVNNTVSEGHVPDADPGHHRELNPDLHPVQVSHDKGLYSEHSKIEKNAIPYEKTDYDVASAEKGIAGQNGGATTESDPGKSKWSRFYNKYRIFFHLIIWLVFTGYDRFP